MSNSPRASSEITELAHTRGGEIGEIAELWDRAEKSLKRTEFVLDELVGAAVNELRYAGFHIVRAIAASDAGNSALYEEQRGKAARHCKRAMYDAAEAILMHYLKKVGRFKEDYSNIPVLPVLPTFLEILGRARASQELLLTTAADDREAFHEQAIACAENLKEDCEALDIAREELNKSLREQRRTSARFAIGIGVTISIGVLGLLVKLWS